MSESLNIGWTVPSRRKVLWGGVMVMPLLYSAWPARAAQQHTRLATKRFEFLSEEKVNLHHFLLAWAAADHEAWPPFAGSIAERESWRASLSAAEQTVWTDALTAYGSTVGREAVLDAGLIAVRDWAAGLPTALPPSDRDQQLMAALNAAMPVYRRTWWPGHDLRNRAWIKSAEGVLLKTEEQMAQHLEAAFGASWPRDLIPVDVVLHPNPLGAYTAGQRITISSTDPGYLMPRSIEMLFHEASHLDAFEAQLGRLIDDAFATFDRKPPDSLWHDMIFYTAGVITQIALKQFGHPDYEPYGQFGVYTRSARWKEQLPLFDQYWRPFLESGSKDTSSRRLAFREIAARLA